MKVLPVTLLFICATLTACGGGSSGGSNPEPPQPPPPTAPPLPDRDNDGVPDSEDTFPDNPAESLDSDNDGVGNNADVFPNDPAESSDQDNDGIGDNSDHFVLNAAASIDNDQDGLPDEWNISCTEQCQNDSELRLDPFPGDRDNDSHPDLTDRFPTDPTEWADRDSDSIGDNSDAFPDNPSASVDQDQDGFPDAWNADCNPGCQNNSGLVLDPSLNDKDNDSHKDNVDVFPENPTEWSDSDQDGTGDNSDAFPDNISASVDADNDGQPDRWNSSCNQQCQADSGLILDPHPGDRDNDSYQDDSDAFPSDPTEWFDSDQDGTGNNADAFPENPAASADADEDGQPDSWNSDCNQSCQNTSGLQLDRLPNDSDNDGHNNTSDIFPLNPNEWSDRDEDGSGDNSDAFPDNPAASTDDDNDGRPDQWNTTCDQNCRDNSGLTLDNSLGDRDNDTYKDDQDVFPDDPAEWLDSDNDLTGDNADAFPVNPAASIDEDNDGYPDSWNFTCNIVCQNESGLILDVSLNDMDNDSVIDSEDAFPSNPNESVDTDNDGTGNNADLNDDNDAYNDNLDPAPEDASNRYIQLDDITDGTRATTHQIFQVRAEFGSSVTGIGDINNDGISDVMISSARASNIAEDNHPVHIIFGNSRENLNGTDARHLESNEGVFINSLINTADSYKSANVGDINGDNIDDLAIAGSYYREDNAVMAGIVYIFFGREDWSDVSTARHADASITFGLLSNPSTSISIDSAGDFNGDNIGDLIIGIPGQRSNRGRAYLISGRNIWPKTFATVNILENQLDGTNGMLITGDEPLYRDNNGRVTLPRGRLGESVSGIGDINNDGFDDVVIGVPEMDHLNQDSGGAFIVFGHETLSAQFDLGTINGSNGVYLSSALVSSHRGNIGKLTTGVGDINNDGLPDLAIGSSANEVYVVTGKSDWQKERSLRSSIQISRNGSARQGNNLTNLSGGYDLNNDGISDLLIANRTNSYVLLGHTDFRNTWRDSIDLYRGDGKIDGIHGLEIQTNRIDSASFAGDIDNDGYADLIFGDISANELNRGESIIFYGF